MGWVGDDDVLCTCTHVTCYATAWWGGVGMMTFFAITRQDFVDTQMTRSHHRRRSHNHGYVISLMVPDQGRFYWYSALTELGVFVKLSSQSKSKKLTERSHCAKPTVQNTIVSMGVAPQLAWRRHKSFSPNWGWLALGKYKWKKELVSGFGKKDLCVVKHGITGRFAIACASWSQGPGHGVTC